MTEAVTLIPEVAENTLKNTAETFTEAPEKIALSLDEFVANPPDRMEWINGQLREKGEMTLRHGQVQLKLGRLWHDYKESSGQGGEVYTEVPCRTNRQGRVPDVAYLTPELVDRYGSLAVLPQSFPLCAEIVSPTDLAEQMLLKAAEYLESGSEEVWFIFPESRWVLVVTQAGGLMFASGQIVKAQKVLVGFSIAIDELFA